MRVHGTVKATSALPTRRAIAGLMGNLTGIDEAGNPLWVANSVFWPFLSIAGVALLALLASCALIGSCMREMCPRKTC